MEGIDLYAVGQLLGHKTPTHDATLFASLSRIHGGAVGKLDGILGGLITKTEQDTLQLVTVESPRIGSVSVTGPN